MGRSRTTIAICLAATCLLNGLRTHGSELTIEKGDLSLPWPSVALYLSFDLAGGVYGAANIVQVAMGTKPDRHWRVGGYVFGGLHSLAGIGFLAASEHNGWERTLLGFGLGHLAWGILTLGTTIHASSMPDEVHVDQARDGHIDLAVLPVVLVDADARLSGGLGICVTGW